MIKEKINKGWLLQKGEYSSIPMLNKEVKEIDLPHDFVIGMDVNPNSINGANTGYYDGGIYTYQKKIMIPKEWKAERVLLAFDGVYGNTTVGVNGHILQRHHYGYTPFTVDVSDSLYYGEENRICVTVANNHEQNSRWYSGGGIYRDVYLMHSKQIHFAVNGLYVHTHHILNEDAFVTVEATIENHTAKDVCKWVHLEIEDGIEGSIKVFIPKMSVATARTQLRIPNVKRWDLDQPYLYPLKAELKDEEELCDIEETRFGVRTISVDATNGFVLNGKQVLLRGGCLHHDNGILGSAAFYDAEYRKLKYHKEAGFNAVRTSHNPVSSHFLDICDELGLLVIEEAFDTWRMSKNYHDFSQYFDEEWEKELTSFIVRDRNHPSIVMWSVGNELPEQGGLSDGYHTSAMLTKKTRELDATRPIIGSLCSFFKGLDDKDNQKFWESAMKEMQAGGGITNLDGEKIHLE